MFDERAFIARVEAAGTDELVQILTSPNPQEEQALRTHLGDERYQRHWGNDPRGFTGFLRGTARDAADVVAAYRDAGADQVNIALREGPYDWDALEAFASEVTPKFAFDDGASLGFVPPFTQDDALAWWRTLEPDVQRGTLALFVAELDGQVIGTAQLHFAQRPNARHRAEVAKVIVGRAYRRRGVARALLAAIDALARDEARTLLVLDTETGSDAENLYRALGWKVVGVVPGWAENPRGGLRGTTIFYKEVH